MVGTAYDYIMIVPSKRESLFIKIINSVKDKALLETGDILVYEKRTGDKGNIGFKLTFGNLHTFMSLCFILGINQLMVSGELK